MLRCGLRNPADRATLTVPLAGKLPGAAVAGNLRIAAMVHVIREARR
jgi:hypothetical protein